jgi:hypothetical protein
MPQTKLELQDLERELHDLGERFSNLDDDDLFVLWFLRAYATENEQQAADSLTGGSGDKDLDALLIDENAKVVFLVQGKYRKKINATSEARNDVLGFAGLAETLVSTDGAFPTYMDGVDSHQRELMLRARERVLKRGYRLKLYYVTLGRFSTNLRKEARKTAKRGSATLDLIDGKQTLRILSDYLDGVAPPVPSLDLEVEAGQGLRSSGPLQRYDGRTDIDSWVFSMTAEAVANLYDRAGTRLFARNIRGFLGSTKINEGMRDTLRREPEYFWYYNNGITIVCDGAEMVSSRGRDVVRVTNPQVINGQQTTRTMHSHARRGRRASVLVRVIRVSRDDGNPGGNFETLVSRIVAATNWQNAIAPSDLRANDRRQVEIERQLRKLGYQYLRKRQTKGEARKAATGGIRRFIKKDEVARAVAACELDPGIVRLGKERLFEEERYRQVFPTGDPHFYLNRYWLSREVSYISKGYPERAYAKWLVLHFMWEKLAPLIRRKAVRSALIAAHERNEAPLGHLSDAIERAFVAALKFYRAKRGKGARALDVSSFFRRLGLHDDFSKFWRTGGNTARSGFNRHWKRFEKELQLAVEE